MLWLFRSGKGLLHSAAVKSRHSEIAFRDASRAMHGTKDALEHLYLTLQNDAPKPLARQVYRSMRRVEKHAIRLRKHMILLREHMQILERRAEQAKKQGERNH